MTSLPAWAGQLNVRHYDTRDGIPQIQASSVHQDANGYLWIGTYGGLARYNGNDFKVFRAEQGLSTSYITVIDSDPRGRLWVGTARGLCRFDDPGFSCFNSTDRFDLMVNDLFAEEDRVWVAADEGLFVHSGDRLEPVSIEFDGAASSAVLALAGDDRGKVWAGKQSGLFRIDADGAGAASMVLKLGAVQALQFDQGFIWAGGEGRLFRIDPDTGQAQERSLPLPPGTWISDIEFDSAGSLWVTTPEGLVRGRAGREELLTTSSGLSNNRVMSLAIDREGMVWAGTDQGLIKVQPGPFEGYTTADGLLASFVRTINQDAAGRLWLGTRQGLQIVERENGRWRVDQARSVLRDDGLPDNRIYSIAFEWDGSAWIATGQGVARWHEERGVIQQIDLADGLPASEVHALLIDRSGRLWISSTRGTRYFASGRVQTPGHEALAEAFALRIREDDSGRLWFATLRHGLLLLEPDGTLRRITGNDGLSDEMLWDLAPSTDGSMWLGSNGDGLFRVWPDGRIERYTTSDGLANNAVWQVLEDDRGRVWAYTNHGLSRLEDGQFVNYSERDGLLHLEGGATGAFQSDDGMLWFASADGLMRYNPDREYRNPLPPPVLIETVVLDGELLAPDARLPYRPGSLVFAFAGLSFQDERAVRFRYRLVGAADGWSAPDAVHRVTYANLGAGNYRFEVMARNPDGVWSERPATFPFSVAAPFWATPWFIAACIIALGLLVWLVIHMRLRSIQAARRRLQQEVDQRTRELSEANRRLTRVARSDQLTGLPNRRYLFDRIDEDVARSRRAHREDAPVNADIAFLLIDLDNFKQINDKHGHDAGDRILQGFSQTVAERLRATDYMIRWGGEEFLVVARETEAGSVACAAARILDAVRSRRFRIDDESRELGLSCSVGIACYPFGEPFGALDWEQVVQLADAALYQAKAGGRDRWAQLLPGDGLRIDDAGGFIQEVKSDLAVMIEAGRVHYREGS